MYASWPSPEMFSWSGVRIRNLWLGGSRKGAQCTGFLLTEGQVVATAFGLCRTTVRRSQSKIKLWSSRTAKKTSFVSTTQELETYLGPHKHPSTPQYDDWELGRCQHYPYYRNLDGESIPSEDEWPVTLAAIQEGWVKDLEGKHRMWVPVEWRVDLHNAGWLRNTTLLLYPPGVDVIVRF